MLTFNMQKKVEILTGSIASDRNSNILSTGVSVKNSMPLTAAADGGRFSCCSNIHLSVDRTRVQLVFTRVLCRRLGLLNSEIVQRDIDCLTVRHSEEPWTRAGSSSGLQSHDICQVRA